MNGQYLYKVDDPLNLLNGRNEDNTNISTYNCYGYAFHTFSWLIPYKSSLYMRALGMIYEEYTLGEIYSTLLTEFSENILEDFNNRIELVDACDVKEYTDKNIEIIAFRLGINYTDEPLSWDTYDEEDLYLDTDFHFQVFRDGCWREKMGDYLPHTLDQAPDSNIPWNGSQVIYDSPIVYFKWKD